MIIHKKIYKLLRLNISDNTMLELKNTPVIEQECHYFMSYVVYAFLVRPLFAVVLSYETLRIGLNGLYSKNVRTDTLVPLIKFSGATQKATKVTISVIAGLIAVPISIKASSGIPYITAKVGSR